MSTSTSTAPSTLLSSVSVGSHAQGMPAAGFVQHLAFLLGTVAMTSAHSPSRSSGVLASSARDEVVPDVADRPPDVGGQQIELLLRLRAETPDGQVASEQQDGELGRVLEVDQVVVEAVEFEFR